MSHKNKRISEYIHRYFYFLQVTIFPSNPHFIVTEWMQNQQQPLIAKHTLVTLTTEILMRKNSHCAHCRNMGVSEYPSQTINISKFALCIKYLGWAIFWIWQRPDVVQKTRIDCWDCWLACFVVRNRMFCQALLRTWVMHNECRLECGQVAG